MPDKWAWLRILQIRVGTIVRRELPNAEALVGDTFRSNHNPWKHPQTLRICEERAWQVAAAYFLAAVVRTAERITSPPAAERPCRCQPADIAFVRTGTVFNVNK
jgi:hypothetical protein